MKQFYVNMLFYLGDLISKTWLYSSGIGYPLYDWLMRESDRLQQKWNLPEPWSDVNDQPKQDTND